MRNALRAATIAVLGVVVAKVSAENDSTPAPQAPEPTGIVEWINSEPLTLKSQQGKVVVLHFWTFGCINCQRNLPFYNQWRKAFPSDKLQIIGVHTPEFDHEADPTNVASAVKERKIKYPVAIDSERKTWRAYGNRYWPEIYLIDKRGRVRYRWNGKLEYQDAGGDKLLRSGIKALLAEAAER
jgi:thiol-disulfide isomerase/thioredoxin